MKTILATAYAINPRKGSEDGMGWNFLLQIARFNRVVAVTRENNRGAIEAYMAEHPSEIHDRIRILYFDTPYWMRFWKKGGRGAMLYYLLWQRMVVPFIRKSGVAYDVVHNLNFHNDWSPSFLWKLNKPFVWGPIGHHPPIPSQYLTPYALRDRLKDRLTWAVKRMFWFASPALRRTVKHADRIWSMNRTVGNVLRIKPGKEHVCPSVATQDFGWKEELDSPIFSLMSVGRLVPLKGFDLTIRSFATFFRGLSDPDRAKVRLTIVGSGPESGRLKDMAEEEGVGNAVIFIEWIDRADVLEMFKNASVFLFPSHEGAGMVVPEALSFGVPVITLDNDGPGGFITPECGIGVPQGTYTETVSGLAQGIDRLYRNPAEHQAMRKAARARFLATFHWDRRGELLNTLYAEL
jgi:glycosyltransferase involved in cell wall biosynthesis